MLHFSRRAVPKLLQKFVGADKGWMSEFDASDIATLQQFAFMLAHESPDKQLSQLFIVTPNSKC